MENIKNLTRYIHKGFFFRKEIIDFFVRFKVIITNLSENCFSKHMS